MMRFRFKDYCLCQMRNKRYNDDSLEEIYETFVTEFFINRLKRTPKNVNNLLSLVLENYRDISQMSKVFHNETLDNIILEYIIHCNKRLIYFDTEHQVKAYFIHRSITILINLFNNYKNYKC